MLMSIFFVILCVAIIYLQKLREKNWVNLVSILIAPYVILVFINNFFVYKIGFYKIEDPVLVMLLSAFCLFYIGGIPFHVENSLLNREEENLEKFQTYHMKKMVIFLYIVGTIGLIKLAVLFVSGQFSIANIDAAEGIMGNGLVGHLLMSSYAVSPIVFLYWTYTKKLKHLLPVLLIMIVTFSSLVKYNIVGVFVSLFIFLMLYKKSLLKKAIIILVTAVVAIFIGNYALTFFIKGETASMQFYLNHLWAYMSGSLIYDNYIFISGIRTDLSIFYKLGTFLCALPNMFLNKLFGTVWFPHARQNDLLISSFGETSNIVDAVGYIFPSKGSAFEMCVFGVVILMIGFLFAAIYRKNMHKSKRFNTFIANFLCYFVFFSFFGTFYIHSGPWEILVYSVVVPQLFYKRKAGQRGKIYV